MMGQFLFGLFAGIVVSLVMEWVIDWTGLLPKKSPGKGAPQKPTQSAPAANGKRVDDQSASATASSLSNAEASGE